MVAIFTEAQRDMLTAAFNRIVPAEDNFPGAGDLGGAQFVGKDGGEEHQITPVVR